MRTKQRSNQKRRQDSGVSLLILAVSMVFILGMAGLGIDLASLYVGRNQAQRAADAAALAGARSLAKWCTSPAGGTISSTCQDIARRQAIAIGDHNLIAGVSPGIQDSDVTFPSISSNDPQIQVVAARNAAHNNAMPTFFVKIFGIDQASVSAKAVAEAYNPSGGPTDTTSQCVKPWLVPNCDWRTPESSAPNSPTNPNCYSTSTGHGANATSVTPTQYAQFTTTPYPTPTNFDPQDSNPVLADPTPQEAATPITIKSSYPWDASAPGEFYPVYLSPDPSTPMSCPSCAMQPGGGGPPSGALYSKNISCCNLHAIHCGPQTLQPIPGDMNGPTKIGVDCLIHEQGGSGQDTYDPSTGVITGGQNNPYPGLVGQPEATSDSIVTVPLYDGHTLCPGGSCPSQVTTTVVGYLQLFVVGQTNGNVTAYVMNVIGCPGSGSVSSGSTSGGTVSGSVSGSGGTPIAVRLIHE